MTSLLLLSRLMFRYECVIWHFKILMITLLVCVLLIIIIEIAAKIILTKSNPQIRYYTGNTILKVPQTNIKNYSTKT